jgi:hypothetical protein
MNSPMCIHCGSTEVDVTQRTYIQVTSYATYEETFHPTRNDCGCYDTCDGCEPETNEVWFVDIDGAPFDMPRHRNEVFPGSHPIHDYELGIDDLNVTDNDAETTSVEFRTTCCGVARDSIEELIRLEEGPALFSNGSESVYSGAKEHVSSKPVKAETTANGMTASQPPTEMDDVLASIADLP